MDTQVVPITIYAEMTPNPKTMKFVANKMILEEGVYVEYTSASEAKEKSPLAEELFLFPFVKSLFITRNFITVTKNDAVEWEDITLELRNFVSDFLRSGKTAVTKIEVPEVNTSEEVISAPTFSEYDPVITSAIDQQIVDLLEEYVRPAVESDGGAINFKSHNDGIVTVIMRGACSGCPSSTATLKGGIETLLKSHIPGIKEVVTENM